MRDIDFSARWEMLSSTDVPNRILVRKSDAMLEVLDGGGLLHGGASVSLVWADVQSAPNSQAGTAPA